MLLNADGLQFESETTNWILGDLPDASDMTKLDLQAKAWPAKLHRDYVATADMHRFCEGLSAEAKRFGSYLQFLSWYSKNRLKVLRKVVAQRDVWAGDPNAKTRYEDIPDHVMHPRNSFDAYVEKAGGTGAVWEDAELQVARDLQSGLRKIEMSFHKALRERQLRKSNAEIRNALVDADYQAHHDQMTGVANRRGFERHMASLKPTFDKDVALSCGCGPLQADQ